MYKIVISLSVFIILFCTLPSPAMTQKTENPQKINTGLYTPYSPPENDSRLMGGMGAGIGVPYGGFGGKLSFGTSLATFDIGMGVLPLAWESAFSCGGTLFLTNKYKTVRPKISIVYSTGVAMNLIMKANSFSSIYKETFEGIAVYAGIDWRSGKTSNICIDLNIGWVFPSVGIDEVERRWDIEKEKLENQGYIVTNEFQNFHLPKLSIGLTYSFGRKLVRNRRG